MRRNVMLAVMLMTVAAMPGLGQAAPATSIPDFSGLWAHPWLPGYEPLDSGPTSLKNLSRRNGVSNPVQLVGDFNNPILKPETVETVKKFGEMSKSYYGFPNPRNQCWPNGLPFVLSSNGLEIFQKKDETLFLYQTDHQVRRVRMNAQHPAKVTPSYFGDSIGRYEGDTLVIDTVGIKPGPFAMIDWFGTPQTPALHVVERYRLIDYDAAREGVQRAYKDNVLPQFNNPPVVDFNSRGKWLQLLFTVDDPNVFTTSWSATVTFGPALQSTGPGGTVWPEDVCGENPNKYGTEEDVKLPTATVADF